MGASAAILPHTTSSGFHLNLDERNLLKPVMRRSLALPRPI